MLEVTGTPNQSSGNDPRRTTASVPTYQQTSHAVENYGLAESVFDPGPHFGKWLQALERNREPVEVCPGVYLQDGDADFAEALSLDNQFPDQLRSDGTLVVTEEGKLHADVEVTVAVIDGLFKGKITATEQVVLENHALVIGEINTPTLTIRGGAIIEGRCYFEPSEHVEAPLPGWLALKVGFAKVLRGRIFQ